MNRFHTVARRAVCALGAVALAASSVCAEKMPVDAPEKLNEILAQKEFAFARVGPSPWELFKARLSAWVYAKLSELWNALPWQDLRIGTSTPVGKFLAGIGAILHEILKVLLIIYQHIFIIGLVGLVVLIVWLAYRWLPRDKAEFSSAIKLFDPANRAQPITWNSIKAMGSSYAALAALREFLRQNYYDQYEYRASLTDREIARAVPASDPHRTAFLEMSRVYERVVFAGVQFDPAQYDRVVNAFEQAARTAQQPQAGAAPERS